MGKTGSEIVMQAEAMGEALEKLADGIVESSRDRQKLVLVGIHTGGVHLARRLQRVIFRKYDLSVPVGTLDITLYRDDWTRLHTQPVVKATDLPFGIDDREVVLVDDVLFTGRTIRAALDALIDYGRPRTVRVAVLVDRGHRELPIFAQFVGLPARHQHRRTGECSVVRKGRRSIRSLPNGLQPKGQTELFRCRISQHLSQATQIQIAPRHHRHHLFPGEAVSYLEGCRQRCRPGNFRQILSVAQGGDELRPEAPLH